MTQAGKLRFDDWTARLRAEEPKHWPQPAIYTMNRHRCHDCGVLEGQMHKPGCDMADWHPDGYPYVRYPNICCRCGKLYPDIFMVADDEWDRYIEPRQRGKMLCKTCYAFIVMVSNMKQKGSREDELHHRT